MVYYDPRKPKPWPIRVLNKLGVADDTKATNIAMALAIIGIIITVLLYLNLLGDDSDMEEIPLEEQLLLERIGS